MHFEYIFRLSSAFTRSIKADFKLFCAISMALFNRFGSKAPKIEHYICIGQESRSIHNYSTRKKIR